MVRRVRREWEAVCTFLFGTFLFILALGNVAAATSSGPNAGGTFADDGSIGAVAWSDPANAQLSDNSRASVNLDKSQASHYLMATNFGFSIPDGSIIDGITASVEKKGPAGHEIRDNSIRLVKGGAILAGSEKSAGGFWGSEAVVTYGAADDLWGQSWTSSDINDPGFGFVISAISDKDNKKAEVDQITLTVDYSPAPDTTPPTLTSVSIASDNADPALAKAGDTVTVSFTADEALRTASATIGGNAASVSNSSATAWTATYVMGPGDAEGAVAFNLAYVDLAGNPGTDVSATTDASSVTFDRTAPETSNLTSPLDGTRLHGTVPLDADAADNPGGSGIAKVEFWHNLIPITKIGEDTSAPYSVDWDTTGVTDGGHNVWVIAFDSAGNFLESGHVAVTLDNTGPVITVTGTNPLTLEVGGAYSDEGATAVDNYDGNVTDGIVTVDPVNPAVVGDYLVTYDVNDSLGNAATQAVRTVHVVDTTPPVITINGENPLTVQAGFAYADAGAAASDNYDGNVTASIVTVDPVNTAALGDYLVTYDVTDAHGNNATQAVRTVHVVDTTLPLITLLGDNPQYVLIGDPYVELGANVSDNFDVGLNASVDSSLVDTGTLGTYTVTYSAMDSSGNPAVPQNRTVNVVLHLPPTFVVNDGTEAGPVRTDTINVNISDGISDGEYGFSADDICNATDAYGNGFSSDVDFAIAGDHVDYLCVKAAGNLTDTGYALVGRLNTDNTPPALVIVSPVDGGSYGAFDGLDLQGTADESAVDIWTNDSIWPAHGNGSTFNFSNASQIAEGAYSVEVFANDSLGNTGSATVSFNVTHAAPELTLNQGSGRVGGTNLTIDGTATAGSVVTVSGGSGSPVVNRDGNSWSATIDLAADQAYAVFVEATMNNQSSNASISLTRDTTGPNMTGVSVNGLGVNIATINWTTDIGSTTAVRYGTASGLYPMNSTEDPAAVTSHTVPLAGLSGGTPYFYRVISCDAVDYGVRNCAESAENTFTTLYSGGGGGPLGGGGGGGGGVFISSGGGSGAYTPPAPTPGPTLTPTPTATPRPSATPGATPTPRPSATPGPTTEAAPSVLAGELTGLVVGGNDNGVWILGSLGGLLLLGVAYLVLSARPK